MLERILIAVLTKLGSDLLTFVIAQTAKKRHNPIQEPEIEKVTAALSEALNGTPVTPEQKAKLREAFRAMVRDGSDNGL